MILYASLRLAIVRVIITCMTLWWP